jgi:molybdopterin converting factor small subunit
MSTEIYLHLMGPAKQFHLDGKLTFPIKNGMTIGALREELMCWLSEHGLRDEMQSILNASVFADTKKILRENDPIQAGSEYVLIPPISGG